ncbi:MAG: hypothetical protein ACE5IM_08655 [Nitrospinota bacterium]
MGRRMAITGHKAAVMSEGHTRLEPGYLKEAARKMEKHKVS